MEIIILKSIFLRICLCFSFEAFPLYMINHVYSAAFKILSLFQKFYYNVRQCRFVAFVLARVHWRSWMYRFMYFIKLWLLGHCFLKILPHPFISLLSSRSFHYVCCKSYSIPQVSWALFTFLHSFFFLFFRLNNFNSPIISVYGFQFCLLLYFWVKKSFCNKPDIESILTRWSDHKFLPGQVMVGSHVPDL